MQQEGDLFQHGYFPICMDCYCQLCDGGAAKCGDALPNTVETHTEGSAYFCATPVAITLTLWQTTSTTKKEDVTMARKPRCKLVGEDGNIFAILGRVRQALKESGQPEQADEVTERVTQAGSYQEALQIIMEYVDGE